MRSHGVPYFGNLCTYCYLCDLQVYIYKIYRLLLLVPDISFKTVLQNNKVGNSANLFPNPNSNIYIISQNNKYIYISSGVTMLD